MAEIADTVALATAKAVPATVTIEITGHKNARIRSRTRGRVRDRDAIRVAVTYRLEELGNGLLDEAGLVLLIRHGVRSTRRAYRLSCTPAVPRNTAAPVLKRAPQEPASEEPAPLIGSAVSGPEQKVADKVEPDSPNCPDLGFGDSAPDKEEPTPRRLTRTQRSTLDVMARQLDLTGAALPQLLGLRCNKTRLDDLTYREAAGLIAHFSRLLRQKLQQEREDKEISSPTKGEKKPPERA